MEDLGPLQDFSYSFRERITYDVYPVQIGYNILQGPGTYDPYATPDELRISKSCETISPTSKTTFSRTNDSNLDQYHQEVS